MAMTNSQYNEYKDMILDIVYHGTKEELENLYTLILVRTGDRDSLVDLDRFYNSKWTIYF